MQRYKLTVEYDGTGLVGWQRQENGPSAQAQLELAIFGFCQEKVDVVCAGRTDAGVHARGQVVHVDLEVERSLYRIQQGINFHLLQAGAQVMVVGIETVDSEFHARFSAQKRVYEYHIIHRNGPLILDHNRAWHLHGTFNLEAMQQASTYLLGTHDFTSFRAAECQGNTPVKTLDRIDFHHERDRLIITVEAKSFLHHMVRNIVGTLVQVAQEKWKPEKVKHALDAKNRCKAGPTAPAHGLYFMKVKY